MRSLTGASASTTRSAATPSTGFARMGGAAAMVIGSSDIGSMGSSGARGAALEEPAESARPQVEHEHEDDQGGRTRVRDLPDVLAEALGVELPDVDREGRRGVKETPRRLRVGEAEVREVVVG